MRRAVVDTSVAVKWFFDEPHAEAARRLLAADCALHAPDFVDIELDHVLAKKRRRGEIDAAEAAEVRGAFGGLPLRRHPVGILRDLAFDLACSHGRGIYDALFVALALLLDAPLVTADRRLYDALTDSPVVGDALVWVEDLPG